MFITQPDNVPANFLALTDAERAMLSFALDLAFDKMVSETGFTSEDDESLARLKRIAGDSTQPSVLRRTHRLMHRRKGATEWRQGSPSSALHWSYESRTKADQRIAEFRERWPEYEFQMIETSTISTEITIH